MTVVWDAACDSGMGCCVWWWCGVLTEIVRVCGGVGCFVVMLARSVYTPQLHHT